MKNLIVDIEINTVQFDYTSTPHETQECIIPFHIIYYIQISIDNP